jgi:hypothetical protein
VIEEGTGSTQVYVDVNLSTGALSGASVGANWANVRTAIVALGNGWYYVALTGRKTNAATTLRARIYLASAAGTTSYSGDGASSIYVWRAALAQSAVAMRLRQTTTTAAAASTQSGSALHLKGLPASTSGLLLAGDWFEIDGQLKMAIAPLNSDAAGLGYLQFSPPLRRSVSDNTPVIVCRPMGRFMFAGDAPGWMNEPGIFSSASIEMEEAFG